ncbi:MULTISPECIES: hypothetical protein [unclassified Myxococcus]|uniref:hypothetical protein n=1 Tax=unclassified Myxococcus TaxID=2648731 RepID=UPI001CBC2B50|nr:MULTISPECIES: hypothetical protein [unclassified Myxococcus]MBZ4394946.1 hypothetical protein [Myxococcus sp. AS-1-15]MBZ4406729.1 hypothetical protein [Myxococcus sp. XM-1-1-1]BDT36508.1 hypothetical protein MFMH1_61770 [Myxococcus sp. MH1]
MSPSLLLLSLLSTVPQVSESTPEASSWQARLSFLASDPNVDRSGSTTSWNAALDARSPELTAGLRAEAELSFFVNANNAQGVSFADNGSNFRLRYRPAAWAADESLALSVFPLSSTRVYLGSVYPVTWGRDVFPSGDSSSEPAVELRLVRQRWAAFVALKSAELTTWELERARHYAVLAGGQVELAPGLRVELEGMYVDRGDSPGLANMGRELSVILRGGSARVFWSRGEPIGDNVDLSLFRGDPTFFERFFTPSASSTGVSASLSLEGSLISQDLEDGDGGFGKLTETSQAAALDGRLRLGAWRFHALTWFRTASFLQMDGPGFPPFMAFPRDADPRVEVSGSLGVDYHLPDWGLTPGLLARVSLPAAFSSAEALGVDRVFIVQGRNQFQVLPVGEDRARVLTLKATARWDLGRVAGVVGEISYVNDPNQTEFRDDVTGVAQPVFIKASAWGATVMLQARF